MTDLQNFLDQPVKNDMGSYDNIRRFETVQGNDWLFTRLSLVQRTL